MNRDFRRSRIDNELRNNLTNVVGLDSDRWFIPNDIDDIGYSDDPWTFENGFGLDEDGNYPEVF